MSAPYANVLTPAMNNVKTVFATLIIKICYSCAMIKSILYLCKYRFQLALKGVLSLIIASFIRQTEITNQSNSHINIPFILCPFCDTWMSTHNNQRSTQCEKKVKKQIYSEPTLPGSKPAQLPLRGAITGARNHLSTILWYFKCSRFLIIILSIQWQIRWIEEYLCLEGRQSTLYSSNIYSPMKLKTIYFMW